MAYKINFEAYSNNFALPQNIIDDDFDKLSVIDLKVILLILKNSNKNYSANLLSNLLNVSEDEVKKSLANWIKKGILVDLPNERIVSDAVVFSKFTQPTIMNVKTANSAELSFLLECMEDRLKRPITSVEHKSIIHILEYIKLPADVIMMAIEYCVTVDKVNARYIEKVCASWADNGITTHELAEQYLNISKSSKTNEDKIKKVFGLQDRNLIDSEREHINRWFNEYGFSVEVIKLGYEKTIGAINKLSFPYLNKILSSWSEKGYKTIEEITGTEYSKVQKEKTSYDLDDIDKFWDNVPKL
ncbi:MAG: DnaD domain protein [Oscillospiraceae bacterium]